MAHPSQGDRVPSDDTEKYNAAIALLTAESQVFWSLTQTFLLAETLLAGFLLQSGTQEGDSWIRIAGAVLGLLVSLLWIAATRRIAGYNVLRKEQAKKLERSDSEGLVTTGVVKKGISTKVSALLLALGFTAFFGFVLAVNVL